jgi:pyruvate/2-oxoacid:ferredoxin oxidoreductase beta subunit
MAFPEDIVKKVSKAKDVRGTKYLQIYASCPPGWKAAPENAVEIARLAVQTRYWPMLEIVDGVYTITRKIKNPKPIEEYLSLQGRFRHLKPDEVEHIQKAVDYKYERLLWLEESTHEMAERAERTEG